MLNIISSFHYMNVDFGTYHHSTPEKSEKLRTTIYEKFHQAFNYISIAKDSKINILDVGSGLGFTIKIAADFYTNASITGIDNFSGSLVDSSLSKSLENILTLGLADRCTIIESDIFDYTGKFELVISNLVMHNMGSMRFEAYTKIYNYMPEYFITGDLFFHNNGNAVQYELSRMAHLFKPVCIINVPEISSNYKILVLKRL